MIETFFANDALATTGAFISAFIIGLSFGWCLEQAGFGSSKRLTGIFYFRDMAVLKVMFSAVVTALLGISFAVKLGYVSLENIYMPETIWGAQIVGGLLFGIGFVIGGWCPGTAAVGLASGKIDALIFLLGSMIGSMIFNESFSALDSLYNMGSSGLRFVYDEFGMELGLFTLIFVCIAILSFWFSEFIEEKFSMERVAQKTRGLWVFSVCLLIMACALNLSGKSKKIGSSKLFSNELLSEIEQAHDHIEPEELSELLVGGKEKIICVDLRSSEEYLKWHIPGARNFSLHNLPMKLYRYKSYNRIVLYSNGMVHPAQTWIYLKAAGFNNVYFLTDGLRGLFDRCLKPASLRAGFISDKQKEKITRWRSWFLESGKTVSTINKLSN